MIWMRHKRTPRFARAIRAALCMPQTDRLAGYNVALWSIAAFFAAGSFVLGILAGGFWWINGIILALDLVMLRWALQGLRFRRLVAEFNRMVRGAESEHR